MYKDNHFYDHISKDGCPNCGNTCVTTVGNTVDPPENYTEWNCCSCNALIAVVDNSPMMYWWELEQ